VKDPGNEAGKCEGEKPILEPIVGGNAPVMAGKAGQRENGQWERKVNRIRLQIGPGRLLTLFCEASEIGAVRRFLCLA
jgi:hypothetical protein